MTNSSSSAASKNVVSRTGAAPVVVPIRGGDGAPLENFAQEGAVGVVAPATAVTTKVARPGAPPTSIRTAVLTIAAAAAIVLTAGVVAFEYWGPRAGSTTPAVAAFTGRATLNSRPAGAAVLVDGVARGVTPIELELPVGPHEVVFHGDAGERKLTIAVERNARVSENVDMPAAGVAASGEIEVTSDPTGAQIGRASCRERV